jgi:hypothetical protein
VFAGQHIDPPNPYCLAGLIVFTHQAADFSDNALVQKPIGRRIAVRIQSTDKLVQSHHSGASGKRAFLHEHGLNAGTRGRDSRGHTSHSRANNKNLALNCQS